MGRTKSIKLLLLLPFIFCFNICVIANNIHVGNKGSNSSIQQAIDSSRPNDTIFVHKGIYKEGNIIINKKLTLIGIDKPVLDGEKKFEIISIKADSVLFDGFIIQHSGFATLDDPCGIKIYDATDVIIQHNELDDNFFGIYIQYGKNCIVKNNIIKAYGIEEQQIGNGIHCWKSDSVQIVGNYISGHRDGIYFEFVTNSIIWRNRSIGNIRYGLHFMFSNHDAYITNIFRGNGAGVAVMFTKEVSMFNNYFEDNWGDAAYGILLKEISDSYIIGNHFNRNTAGLYLEGASRILIHKNSFTGNGWAMKIQASCMDNSIEGNNFLNNTFDASTNGSLVLNTFNANYWDKYEGYDLNKDRIGDIPFHPLSLFSVLIEKNPPTMLLFRSFMVTLLEKSERMIPSLTPENFIDNQPSMRPFVL